MAVAIPALLRVNQSIEVPQRARLDALNTTSLTRCSNVMRYFAALFCLVAMISCGDSSSDAPTDSAPVPATPDMGCATAAWSLDGANLSRYCTEIRLSLAPGIQTKNGWLSASQCSEADDGFDCTIDNHGRLKIKANGQQLTTTFIASKSLQFHGHGFRGTLKQPGAMAWLSMAFSHGLNQASSPFLSMSLRTSGTTLSVRGGLRGFEVCYELSWWHTFVSSQLHLVFGTLSANAFKSWIGVSGTDPNYTIVMMSGGTGEAIDVDQNDTIRGESWFIGLDTQRDAVLKEYGNQLPSRRESLLQRSG